MTRRSTTHVRATRLELVDHHRNHDKFYDVVVVGSTVVCHFGRNSIGGVGQWTRAETYPTAAEARYAADDKLTAKRAKGYRSVGFFEKDLDGDVPATDLSVRSAVSVALNNATWAFRR